MTDSTPAHLLCWCGCGEMPVRPTSRFRSGHDAAYAQRMAEHFGPADEAIARHPETAERIDESGNTVAHLCYFCQEPVSTDTRHTCRTQRGRS
jgi:hypothetical protein